jgi:hypothetical protein
MAEFGRPCLSYGRHLVPTPHPSSPPQSGPHYTPPWTSLSPPTRPKASHKAHPKLWPRTCSTWTPSRTRAVTRRAATPRRPPSPRENARLLVSLPDASRARTPPRLPPARCHCPPRGIGRSRRPSPVPCPPWPIKTHPRTHSALTPPHSFPSTSTLSLESTQGAALGCCSLQRRSPAR